MKRACLTLLFAAVAIVIANGSASAQMQLNRLDQMNPMVGESGLEDHGSLPLSKIPRSTDALGIQAVVQHLSRKGIE